jgi:hypothetical protein
MFTDIQDFIVQILCMVGFSFLFAFSSILIMVNGSTDALCARPGSYSIKLHPLVH